MANIKVTSGNSPYSIQGTYNDYNNSGSNGGVFEVFDGGTVSAANVVSFKDNTANIGGAIYVGSNGFMELNGATFSKNHANQGAGAVKACGGSVAFNSDTLFDGNFSYASNNINGGAIYRNPSGNCDITFNGGSVTFNKNYVFCTATGASNYVQGGAIYSLNTSVGPDAGSGGINFTNCTVSFTDNSATVSAGLAKGRGGAIYNNNSNIDFTGSTVYFSGNSATTEGGAVYNYMGTITFADATFSNNTAAEGNAIFNAGAINMKGVLTLENGQKFVNAHEGPYDGTLNWDLTGGTAAYGSLHGYQNLSNETSDSKLYITVDSDIVQGFDFVIATGDLSDTSYKGTFYLTGIKDIKDVAITLGPNKESAGTAEYNGVTYRLYVDDNGTTSDATDDNLILSTGKKIAYELSESVNTVYDGTAKSITVTVTDPEVTDATIEYSIDGGKNWTATEDNSYTVTDACGKTTVQFRLNTTVQGYVETITDAKTIEITKRHVVLNSISTSKTYDGEALVAGVSVSGLGWAEGEGATYSDQAYLFDVGSIGNTFSYKLNENTKENNYDIDVAYGTLTVNKRNVVLVSGSTDEYDTYDGSEHFNHEITVGGWGWADGEGATYSDFASLIEVDSTGNTFSYELNKGTRAPNYDITTEYGTVAVLEQPENLIVPREKTIAVDQAYKTITFIDNGILNIKENVTVTSEELTLNGGHKLNNYGTMAISKLVINGVENVINGSDFAIGEIAVNGEVAIDRTLYSNVLANSAFADGFNGKLFVTAVSGVSLTTQDVDALMAKINLNNVDFDQDLISINKLTFNDVDAVKTISFKDAYGTSGNDTIRFAKNSDVVLGQAGYVIDLADGSNKVQVDKYAKATILSDLANVSTVKVADKAAETHFAAIDFADGRKGSFSIGSNTAVAAGNVTGSDKKTTIEVGKDSAFVAGAINFEAKNGSVTIGNRSGSRIESIGYANKVEIKHGKKDSTWTEVNVIDSITGTEYNDKIVVGKYSQLNVGGLIDLGTGKNKIVVDNNTAVVLKADETGADSLTKISIGKGSEAYLSSELIARGLELNSKFGKNANIYDIGSADVAVNFTDIKTEQADNTAETARTLTGGACTGWLDASLDVADFFTAAGDAKINVASADETITLSINGEVKALNTEYLVSQNDIVEISKAEGSAGSYTLNTVELIDIITVCANDGSKMYDGTALTENSTTILDGTLAEGHTFSATVVGSQTLVGTSPNVVTDCKVVDSEGTDVTDLYGFVTVDGKLEVIPNTAMISIQAMSTSKVYDGTPLTAGYETAGELVKGDTLTATTEGKITHYDANGAANMITGWTVTNENGEDVTDCYSNIVAFEGMLMIEKRAIELTSRSASKEWDGSPLTCEIVDVTSELDFVAGEGATYDNFASITDLGSTENTFEYTLSAVTNAEDYTIEKKYGTLEIAPPAP